MFAKGFEDAFVVFTGGVVVADVLEGFEHSVHAHRGAYTAEMAICIGYAVHSLREEHRVGAVLCNACVLKEWEAAWQVGVLLGMPHGNAHQGDGVCQSHLASQRPPLREV